MREENKRPATDYDNDRVVYDEDYFSQVEDDQPYPTRSAYHGNYRDQEDIHLNSVNEDDANTIEYQVDNQDELPTEDDGDQPIGQRARYHAGIDRFLNNGILICAVLLIAVLLVAFLV